MNREDSRLSFGRRAALGRLGALTLGGMLFEASARAAGAPVLTPAVAFDRAGGILYETRGSGLVRSVDGGQRWARLAAPGGEGGGRIVALAVSAGGRGVLFAGRPVLGVLRSDDRGHSWSARNIGLPSLKVTALAAHADQPATLYAYVAGHGIFRSEDEGLHWQQVDAGPREPIVQLVHSNMPGSMQSGWLFAATAKGVQRAMDCFCGWRDAGGLRRPVRALAYDPRAPRNVWAVTDDGLYLSADGGEGWSGVNSPAADLRALAATPAGELFAMTGDGALYRSPDGAQTWTRPDA